MLDDGPQIHMKMTQVSYEQKDGQGGTYNKRPKTTFYTVECGHQGDEFYEHAIEVFHRHLNCLVSVDEEFGKVCKR